MGLNFLENLGFNEAPQPLASLSELSNVAQTDDGKSEADKLKQTDDGNQEGNNQPVNTDSGLLSFDGAQPNTEDTKTPTPDDKTKNQPGKTSDKKYVSLLKELNEKIGIFEEFKEEDFEDNLDTIIEYLEEWSDTTAESKLDTHIKSNLNPEVQRYLDLIDTGVSREDAAEIMKDYKSLASITPEKITEDTQTAKDVYAQYLRNTTTFSSDKIKKEVERIEKLGTIEEEAKEILPELIKIVENKEKQAVYNAQRQQEMARIREEKEAKAVQEFLNSTNEIGGIKLSKRAKDKWLKEYSTVRTPDGNLVPPIVQTRAQNPNEFDALLRFYNSIGLFNYDGRSKTYKPDFEALKSLGMKESVQKFSDSVASENARSKAGGQSPESIDLTPDKKEMVDRMKEWSKAYKASKDNNPYNIIAGDESNSY